MNLEELQLKYKNVPLELKNLKRWVCFKVEGTENGKTTKRPYNAINGKLAKVNDELTWSRFNIALSGCAKFKCDGIGFILGNGIFGIDLDNHPDENGEFPMSEEEFGDLCDEFVETLDSYSERSQSGLGVHIICQGKLPTGGRRKGSVEMYDNGRFFAFTGDSIRNIPINNREEEVKPLWEKYINVKSNFIEPTRQTFTPNPYREVLNLSDEEVINTAIESKNGTEFYRYYHDGDISMNNNDASSADMSFCNMLAFWCNGDRYQMDRIFRNSALMRDKWDELRGEKTYGEITIDSALNAVSKGYVKTKPIETPKIKINNTISIGKHKEEKEEEFEPLEKEYKPEMNIDENGEPIFRLKKIYEKYPYTDTGNAMRFYGYFGEIFRYNVTDKCWMYWTGKTWIRDVTKIIRKYANKMIEILKSEEKGFEEQIEKLNFEGKKDDANTVEKMLDACRKNTNRVSNKAGKDAMLSELETLFDIPVQSSEFNKNDYLLNTDSGIVDLLTGEIRPFDKEEMISKNTGIKVSYNEPTEWLKFLYSVFDNGDEAETKEVIDSLQTCLGYSISGSVKEQVMFLLYGGGSNGKSTLTELVADIFGDYADNIASSALMQQKNANQTTVYSIAKLQQTRFVETGETDDGGKLAEAQLKILTGGDTISAQFKYGNEFSFKPKFKIWMSTNNKPIIRGTDLGIWRRIFIFPFLNSFTGAKKNKNLPELLRKEASDILGWIIKGHMKYMELGDLIRPKRLEMAKQEYKDQMDIIAQFISKECKLSEKDEVDCKLFYTYYKNWALDNTEFTMKESKFSDELKAKGINRVKGKGGNMVYQGIKIVDDFYLTKPSNRY